MLLHKLDCLNSQRVIACDKWHWFDSL